MVNHLGFTFRNFLIVLLSFQLVSCGTLLYPERKGQVKGKLDLGVVLLDGIGLLFFLIPGIIAFAVDFHHGTIYLPNSAKNTTDAKYKIVKFDPKEYTPEMLEAIIKKETGKDFDFEDGRLKISKIESYDELPLYLANLKSFQVLQISVLRK